MPERKVSKSQMRQNWSAAMARANGGEREDAAVDKIVASSTTSEDEAKPTEDTTASPATTTTPAAKPPVQPVKPVAKPNFATQWGKSLGPKAQAKTYQKHVLFALVTAFLIQFVAAGKSLPKKA